MPSTITLQTKDGRIIQGINYTVNTATLPRSIDVLASRMPGQMPYGVYHVRTHAGWRYIPALNIAAVVTAQAGAQT